MGISQRKFTDEQIELASHMNIITYAQSRGYNLKKIANNSYKIPGYGGLYINGDGSKWNWFSRDKGGGPIQFVMEIEGKKWIDAICSILNLEEDDLILRPKSVKAEVKTKFVLPEKNDTYKHVIAYLVQTRGINKDIVYDLINKNKLYENSHKSCVFVGFDDKNVAKYASVRSTAISGNSFRGDVKGSDKSYPFAYQGSSATVCVFEAPIDLMSYLTLIKKHKINNFSHHLISLGGVADKALDYYLTLNPDIQSIILCLDNDEAGHFACQQLNEKYYERYKILRHNPIGKDFNEDLLSTNKERNNISVREPPDCYMHEDLEL